MIHINSTSYLLLSTERNMYRWCNVYITSTWLCTMWRRFHVEHPNP